MIFQGFLISILGLSPPSSGRRFWKLLSKTKNLNLVPFSKTSKFETMWLEKCEGNISFWDISSKVVEKLVIRKISGIRVFFKQTVQTMGGRHGCCKLQECVERVYHLKIPVIAVRIVEPKYADILICTYYMTFSCFESFY